MNSNAKPWYREFWLWFVLTPPIATVIGAFATLIIAGAPPAMVVDDYSQIALAVERDRARDERARNLGLVADLAIDEATGSVSVQLTGAAPERLRLDLVHPTLAERDVRAWLEHAGNSYRGAIQRSTGRLYLQLADESGSWRLTGELGAGRNTVRLQPRAAP